MWDERNTGTNLPAQIELYAEDPDGHPDAYKFLFMAKGGGSANKSYLYQETKALLNPTRMMQFLEEKLRLIGTAACPPYHLAIVVGGTSAEYALKTAKYASAKYLDALPTAGSMLAHGFRDLELEAEVLELTRQFGIGAQFGGRYFCHDVRVVRLPRHGASCPVAIAVSCSADRQALAKITPSGVWLERLETDPARFLPDVGHDDCPTTRWSGSTSTGRWTRSGPSCRSYPVKTRLSLSGPLVVARDIAHAKIAERLDAGEPMPAVPARPRRLLRRPGQDPGGLRVRLVRPDHGRPDGLVRGEVPGRRAARYVMLAKGNRSKQVTDACQRHGGFYLGSIGGPAARLAQDCIRHVEVLEYPELGMEAVWKIEVEDFPAFIVVDDKGNDFFAETATPVLTVGRR